MNVHQRTESSTTEISYYSIRSLCFLHGPLYYITRPPPSAVYFTCSEFAHVKIVWCEKRTQSPMPASWRLRMAVCLWYPRYHAQIKTALIHHKDYKLQNASQSCTHANSKIQLHISFVLADLSQWNIVYCPHTAGATEVFARYAKLGRVSNTGWRELPEPLISVRYCYKQFKEYIRYSRCSVCSSLEHLSLHTHVSNACWWFASRPKTRLKIETVIRYCFTLQQTCPTSAMYNPRRADVMAVAFKDFRNTTYASPLRIRITSFLVIWWNSHA